MKNRDCAIRIYERAECGPTDQASRRRRVEVSTTDRLRQSRSIAGRRLRPDCPLINSAGDLDGEAPLAQRRDD
jgi:hypothetical protein